jgi:hypothetical protein
LFDIQGEPATTDKDKEWGICYNSLIRGKDDIIKTLKDNKVQYKLEDGKNPEKAFMIETEIDNINLKLISVYGNRVIESLFFEKQKHDIEHLKVLLEEMLSDDLWLAQIITISERAILDQNFKKHKNLNNYVLSILSNKEILDEAKNFQTTKDIKNLESITEKTIKLIEKFDKNLLGIRTIPAEIIFSLSNESYKRKDYVADLIQFLSCEEITNNLENFISNKS